jgi:hypothetical protein
MIKMTDITKSQRAQIIDYIASSTAYDADTVRITRDGMVTARKTAAGHDPHRYNVGFADELLHGYADFRGADLRNTGYSFDELADRYIRGATLRSVNLKGARL